MTLNYELIKINIDVCSDYVCVYKCKKKVLIGCAIDSKFIPYICKKLYKYLPNDHVLFLPLVVLCFPSPTIDAHEAILFQIQSVLVHICQVLVAIVALRLLLPAIVVDSLPLLEENDGILERKINCKIINFAQINN